MAAMATVFVVTAGSGDSYRIERVYLDSEQAYGFAQDYNGIAPTEPVQVEEWQVGSPPAAYDGPYWRAGWWARVPAAKRRSMLRYTHEGERFDDVDIRPGMVDRRGAAGCQGGAPRTRRNTEGGGGGPVEGEGRRTVLGDDHPGQGGSGGSATEVISTM